MGNPAHDLSIICSRNFTTIHPVYQFLCQSHFLSVSVFLLCPVLVLLRYDAFVSVCLPQSVCVFPHDVGLCVIHVTVLFSCPRVPVCGIAFVRLSVSYCLFMSCLCACACVFSVSTESGRLSSW